MQKYHKRKESNKMVCNICDYDFPFFDMEDFLGEIEEDVKFLKYTFEHYCSCNNECDEEKGEHWCEVDPTLNSDYEDDVKQFKLILAKKESK